MSRQFYVAHSCNSSQVAAGGLRYKDRVLVCYSTHSSTDRSVGMGSCLKHSLGPRADEKEMIKRLQRLNKGQKHKPAAVTAED